MKSLTKKFVVVFLLVAMVTGLIACTGSPSAGTPTASDNQTAAPTSGSTTKPFEITVMIKGESGEFWQMVKSGAQAAEAELGDKVKITYSSTVDAADNEGQITLFLDVLTSQPDAIVVGPCSEGTAALFQEAVDGGAKLVVLDTNYGFENYSSYIVSDNKEMGAAAAQAIVDALNAAGKPLEGSVCIISAKAGPQSLADRDEGFITKMREIAPNIKILETQYAEGDITKAMGATQDVYLANSDTLVGLYGDANTTGNAIAQAVKEANLEGKFFVVATDSDDAEIEALRNGTMQALFVQDSFDFGYSGVMNAYKALIGEEIEAIYHPPIVTVTLENIDLPEIQRILDPSYGK